MCESGVEEAIYINCTFLSTIIAGCGDTLQLKLLMIHFIAWTVEGSHYTVNPPVPCRVFPRVFPVNLLACITAKILQCGKAFIFMQIRRDIFRNRSNRVRTWPWNWGLLQCNTVSWQLFSSTWPSFRANAESLILAWQIMYDVDEGALPFLI